MLYFENDYSEGAHPKILEALTKTNYESLSGYGSDEYCERAKEKIKKAWSIVTRKVTELLQAFSFLRLVYIQEYLLVDNSTPYK